MPAVLVIADFFPQRLQQGPIRPNHTALIRVADRDNSETKQRSE
jgi:hypothetical protein